jgi:hypothetical protein
VPLLAVQAIYANTITAMSGIDVHQVEDDVIVPSTDGVALRRKSWRTFARISHSTQATATLTVTGIARFAFWPDACR